MNKTNTIELLKCIRCGSESVYRPEFPGKTKVVDGDGNHYCSIECRDQPKTPAGRIRQLHSTLDGRGCSWCGLPIDEWFTQICEEKTFVAGIEAGIISAKPNIDAAKAEIGALTATLAGWKEVASAKDEAYKLLRDATEQAIAERDEATAQLATAHTQLNILQSALDGARADASEARKQMHEEMEGRAKAEKELGEAVKSCETYRGNVSGLQAHLAWVERDRGALREERIILHGQRVDAEKECDEVRRLASQSASYVLTFQHVLRDEIRSVSESRLISPETQRAILTVLNELNSINGTPDALVKLERERERYKGALEKIEALIMSGNFCTGWDVLNIIEKLKPKVEMTEPVPTATPAMAATVSVEVPDEQC